MDESTVSLEVDSLRGLEVRRWTPLDRVDEHDAPAPVVLLHEALGSAGTWGRLPMLLAARTGREVVALSREGHGRSSPAASARGPDYLHREAARLGADLDEVVGDGPRVLLGHSDGATIALLHAMLEDAAPVSALVLVAPHVVVEEETIVGLLAAREWYREGDLRDRLARHHDDVDALFHAWNDLWLSPGFRDWDVTEGLASVRQPVLLVQCVDDGYATLRQLDLVEQGVSGRVTRLVPVDGGHAPHLTRPRLVVGAVAGFLDDVVPGPAQAGDGHRAAVRASAASRLTP